MKVFLDLSHPLQPLIHLPLLLDLPLPPRLNRPLHGLLRSPQALIHILHKHLLVCSLSLQKVHLPLQGRQHLLVVLHILSRVMVTLVTLRFQSL